MGARGARRALGACLVAAGILRVALVARAPVGTTGGDARDYLGGFSVGSLPEPQTTRPPVTNNVFALLGDDPRAIVTFQSILAALCWGFLAWTVWRLLRTGWLGWVGTGWITALSFTSYVLAWDSQLLSESLALSFLALWVALALRVAAEPQRLGWWVALTAAGGIWALERSTQTVLVAAAAVGLGALACWRSRRSRRSRPSSTNRRMLAAGLVLGLCAALGIAQQTITGGSEASLHSTMGRTVLAGSTAGPPLRLSDRAAWFHDHGMPVDAAVIRLVAGRKRSAQPLDDLRLAAYRRWVEDSGEATWLAYLAAHPAYVARQIVHGPIFLRPGATIIGIEQTPIPHLYSRVVGVDDRTAFLLAAAAAVALGAWRRCRSLIVPAAIVALGCLGLVVAFFGDPLEQGRHLLPALLQVRMGIVLIALCALDDWRTAASDGQPVE